MEQLTEGLLKAQVAVITAAQSIATRARNRAVTAITDEDGQTPTEYLMIVGLMAAIIVIVFMTFFWDTIRSSASSWATKVSDAISGKDVK